MLGGFSFILSVFLIMVLIFEKPVSIWKYNRWVKKKNEATDKLLQHYLKEHPEKNAPKSPKYIEEYVFNEEEKNEFIKREAIRKYIRKFWMELNPDVHPNKTASFGGDEESVKIMRVILSNFGGMYLINKLWEYKVFESNNVFAIAARDFLSDEYCKKYILKLPFANIIVPVSEWQLSSSGTLEINNDYGDFNGQDIFNNNWLFYETIVKRLCDYYKIEYRFDFFQSNYLGHPWNQYVEMGGSDLRSKGFSSEDEYKQFVKTYKTVSNYYNKCIDNVLNKSNNIQKLNLKYNIIPKYNENCELNEKNLQNIISMPDFIDEKEIEHISKRLAEPPNINL